MQHLSKRSRVGPWRAGYGGVVLLIATGLSQAQMGPGAGGGMGGGPPGGGKPATPAAGRTLTLDDLIPPDPWRIWQERLLMDAPRVSLRQEQLPRFNDFVRELGEASQLKGVRTLRSMRGALVVSAVTDVSRDFRLAIDDAREWVSALQDLDSRRQALRAVLSPAQQAQMDASYAASREAARTRATGVPPAGHANAGHGPPH